MRRKLTKVFSLAVISSVVLAQGPQELKIARASENPATTAPPENFTGVVRLESLIRNSAPSRIAGARVTFEPGARTAWHTHPLGQTLIVTGGSGLVQHWGGKREEIREGDVVWIPPNVKHWHGASASTRMSHVALVEVLDGKTVEWMEKVTDRQFDGD